MNFLTVFAVLSASILLPGTFHGDEIPPGSEGDWLALVVRGEAHVLERVTAEVEVVTDPLLDFGNERSGRAVRISPDLYPVVLIRDAEDVAAGPVPTVLVRQDVELSQPVIIDLADRKYRFSIDCGEAFDVAGYPQKKCALLVDSADGVERLAFYTMYQHDGAFHWIAETPPKIAWAGDLNRDGKLDVLLYTSEHYNVGELSLYLSNRRNSKYGEPAVFRSVGC